MELFWQIIMLLGAAILGWCLGTGLGEWGFRLWKRKEERRNRK